MNGRRSLLLSRFNKTSSDITILVKCYCKRYPRFFSISFCRRKSRIWNTTYNISINIIKPRKSNSARIEFRALDSACNPYLAFTVILAAGLKGIEEGYELPPGASDDVWALTDAERRALGIMPLPQSLDEALRVTVPPYCPLVIEGR